MSRVQTRSRDEWRGMKILTTVVSQSNGMAEPPHGS